MCALCVGAPRRGACTCLGRPGKASRGQLCLPLKGEVIGEWEANEGISGRGWPRRSFRDEVHYLESEVVKVDGSHVDSVRLFPR